MSHKIWEMGVTGYVWLCLLFKFQIKRMHKVITLNEKHFPCIVCFIYHLISGCNSLCNCILGNIESREFISEAV